MQKFPIAGVDTPACAVLVVSCDRYGDLWPRFFTEFGQHWPKCEFPIFLGTNEADARFDGVTTLKCGRDTSWSQNLRRYLEQVKTSYILLLLEDFFLDRPVSSAQVRRQLQILHGYDGVCMRLYPNPPADYFANGMGIIHQAARYRVSTQAALWNREKLLSLVTDGETAWEFESRATIRSRAFGGTFYCTREPVIHYRHVVEQGKWFRAAARLYRPPDSSRAVMEVAETWKKVPARQVRRLINRLESKWLCFMHPETQLITRPLQAEGTNGA